MDQGFNTSEAEGVFYLVGSPSVPVVPPPRPRSDFGGWRGGWGCDGSGFEQGRRTASRTQHKAAASNSAGSRREKNAEVDRHDGPNV